MSRYLELKKKAMLMSNNPFWLPDGVSHSEVIAAYQCKGAASKAEALTDLTQHGYTLTANNSVNWNASRGLYGGTITQQALTNLAGSVVTIVIRYGNYTLGNYNKTLVKMKYPEVRLSWHGDGTRHGSDGDWYTGPYYQGLSLVYKKEAEDTSSGHHESIPVRYSGINSPAAGVVGFTHTSSPTIFVNGVQATVSGGGVDGWTGVSGGGEESNQPLCPANCDIYAAAFYNRALSAKEQFDIYTMMMGII